MKNGISFLFVVVLVASSGVNYCAQPEASAKPWLNTQVLTGFAAVGLAVGACGTYHFKVHKPLACAKNDRRTLARLQQNVCDIEASFNEPYSICSYTRQKLGMLLRPPLARFVDVSKMRNQSAENISRAIKFQNRNESLQFYIGDALQNVEQINSISPQAKETLNTDLVCLKSASDALFAQQKENKELVESCKNIVQALENNTHALVVENNARLEQCRIKRTNVLKVASLGVALSLLSAGVYSWWMSKPQ